MRTARISGTLSMLLAVSLFNCEKKVESLPTPIPAPAPAPPVSKTESVKAESAQAAVDPAPSATPTVPAHMREHFVKSTELKKAVVDDKLANFKAAAVWMAEHELAADLPEAWKSGVEAMKDAARLGRDAVALKDAAASLGATGAACANCHEKHGGPRCRLANLPRKAVATPLTCNGTNGPST